MADLTVKIAVEGADEAVSQIEHITQSFRVLRAHFWGIVVLGTILGAVVGIVAGVTAGLLFGAKL